MKSIKMNRLLLKFFLITLICNVIVNKVSAAVVFTEIEVPIESQDLSIKIIPSKGNSLIIWVAPGFGTHQRAMDTSVKLSNYGVEIWHVDLSESLFLPKSTTTMRQLEGKYLAGLVEYAHKKTKKNIILLTRSYGAIPVLRAMRIWQIKNKNIKPNDFYLQGAILFSPELYSKVPELGLEPEFVNIVDATNMPLMIYQGEKRSNRWQVKKLLKRLEASESQVYFNLLKGVNGVFYSKDNKPETLSQLERMPKKLKSTIRLLEKTEKPKVAAALKSKTLKKSQPLDVKLKPFKGKPIPYPLDLIDVRGIRHKKDSYKGKVTVVNFWATWCPPCVEEIPSLNHLRELMKDEKFELISVNYGEDKQTVQGFMQKVHVDFPVLLDPDGKQSAKWNVLVFPSTFVIGPNGKIQYGINAAIHWDNEAIVKKLKSLVK